MNASQIAANQIADELENIYWIQGDGKGKPFQQYADFIRQQQSEIEALKADKDRITRDLIGASFYEHDYKTLLPKYEALKKQNGQLEFMVGYLEQEVFELKGN